MKKKILTILLSIFMITTAFTTRVFASEPQVGEEITVDGIKYYIASLDDSRTVGVYFNESCTKTDVVIPSSISYGGNEYTVTSIVFGAFGNNNQITSLSIPSTVTSIGEDAFIACSNLANITLSEGLESIGANAFVSTNITTITIPSSVTSIGTYAFGGCDKLETVICNATNPPSLDVDALDPSDNEHVKKILVPAASYENYINEDSNISKGWSAYKDKIATEIGATGNESNVKAWLTEVTPATNPKTYTLTIQGTGAMADLDNDEWPWNSNRSSITSVVISDGVTTIGMNAFNNCSDLTSVIMPNTITSIGRNSFNECSSLTSIELSNSLTTIGMDAFQNSGLNSIVIPATVSSIKSSAFGHCTSLSSVKILNSTPPTIGDDLFKGCPNLHIYVPENAVSRYKDAWTTYRDNIEAIPVTIANVLANSANTFPTTAESGWVASDGTRMYIDDPVLKTSSDIPLDSILTSDGDNYSISPSIGWTYKFIMQSGILTRIDKIPLGQTISYYPYAYTNPSRSITVGSTSDVEFETNAVYTNDGDVTVKVDGNTLTLNTHYTQYQGSTHVILKGSYLSTLAAGTHTITIGVTGYSDINQDFTITATPSPAPDLDPTPRYKAPNTGVEGTTNNHSLLKLSSLSLLAIGTYMVIKKKKDN